MIFSYLYLYIFLLNIFSLNLLTSLSSLIRFQELGTEIESNEINTIAAHHDDEFIEEELQAIEEFKQFVLSKRKNK